MQKGMCFAFVIINSIVFNLLGGLVLGCQQSFLFFFVFLGKSSIQFHLINSPLTFHLCGCCLQMFLFLKCTAPFQIQSCMHSSWQRLKFGKITVGFGEYHRENCSLKYSDSPQTLWQCKHNEGLVLLAHHAGVFFYLFRISGRVVYLLVVSHSAGLSKQLL